MKKTPDVSETLAKGAAEAKEVLQHTASLIEAEWQRLTETIAGSGTVPDSVKSAVDRLGDTAGEVRDFVVAVGPQVVKSGTRIARQAGVPIPEGWMTDPVDDVVANDADDPETIGEDTVVDDDTDNEDTKEN